MAEKKKYNYTKKTGRPTLYKPEYCQEMIEASKNGISPNVWAKDNNLSLQVTYNWEEQYPEFLEAKKVAYSNVAAEYERFVEKAMRGETPCVPALVVWRGKNLGGGFRWSDNKDANELKKRLVEVQEKIAEWRMSGGFDKEDVEKALETIAGAIDSAIGKKK